MPSRPTVEQQYRYDQLTWPEVDAAARLKKVVILPIGAVQQHGPHLPVDADALIVTELALEAGRRRPEAILVAPTVAYSYSQEGMDFPGTASVAPHTFMNYCVAVARGFAYHGFDHILLLNGYPANDNLVEFVGRQINLETQALCGSTTWTRLLRIDAAFSATWRESRFPGSAHADELETSVYLAIDPAAVDMARAEDHAAAEDELARYVYEDLAGAGAIYLPGWTSARSPSGVLGEPTKASAEKGRRIFEEAVARLLDVLDEFRARPKHPSVDHHTIAPLGPLPLGVS